MVAPEFSQEEVNGPHLAGVIRRMLEDKDGLLQMKQKMAQINQSLGDPGARPSRY